VVLSNRITAAGAVVTRDSENGLEFLLVYREFRNDWTFPKGKLEPGENIVGTAVREVREETGYAIRLGVPLPQRHYQVDGVPKDVYYWHATVLEGDFSPNEEVSSIAWVSRDVAEEMLTYAHDIDVLNAANEAVQTVPLIIMRHTQALKRVEWSLTPEGSTAPDSTRPLTAVGRMQANALVSAMAAFGITQVHSSDSRRCQDTVGPYAGARSLRVILESSVSEEQHSLKPDVASNRVQELAQNADPIVLCTHRPVMPTVMSALSELLKVSISLAAAFDPALTPGSMVIFHRDVNDLNKVIAVERHIH
jgi:8-oxo-dGTP diphosphatase